MEIRVTGIDSLIGKLKTYQKSLEDKQYRLLEELAKIGIDVASDRFQTAQYDGENDVVVNGTPEWVGENRLFVTASGKSILFIEFGSGSKDGYGHEWAESLGYGPGTWSDDESKGGKHHWDSEKGWYYEHGKESWGNPPARAMYDSAKEMREKILNIAREVFGSD